MAALTDLDIGNQALQMLSARYTMSSFTENSKEAKNINPIYNRIRDQVMTMAWWNFARRTELLSLLKAAPGTPEGPSTNTPWNSTQPAPPWLYEYEYPDDCLLFRYVTQQPNAQASALSPPLTSALSQSGPWWPSPPAKFIVATDFNPLVTATITAISKASPCLVTAANSFSNGQRVTLSDIAGMVQLNANTYLVANRTATNFTLQDLNGTAIDSTTYTAYTSGGSAMLQSIKCVLTNMEYALGIYMAQITDPTIWPVQFVNAFATALAAFLAFPITGKLQLKNELLAEANSMILEARKSDGNEGLTTQDYTPDWIRIRGGQPIENNLGSDQFWAGNYLPLFTVS